MNEGQKYMFAMIDNFVRAKKEYFEANKERLEKETAENVFRNMGQKEKDSAIAVGAYDKSGRYIGVRSRRRCDQGYQYRTIYGDWKENIIGPLLKTMWSQEGEYNDNVPIKCEYDEAPLGCVAVALGQIMAYHKKPARLDNRNLHWNEMTAFPFISELTQQGKKNIQYLLERLGRSDLLNMHYSCDGSGASTDNAVNTFKKLGLGGPKKEKFYENSIVFELENNRPVYIEGSRKYIDRGKEKFIAHAWVIDGYKEKKRECIKYTRDLCRYREHKDVSFEYKSSMLHHNLGWGKNSDCWLDIKIFGLTLNDKNENPDKFNLYNNIIVNVY